jgi:hypothetical protein
MILKALTKMLTQKMSRQATNSKIKRALKKKKADRNL